MLFIRILLLIMFECIRILFLQIFQEYTLSYICVIFYRPRQSNIFTSVCHSAHGGGVCQTPPRQTPPLGRHPPPRADTPGTLGRHPQADTPRQMPHRQTSPWADTSRQTPPGKILPGQTPPRQNPLGSPPPRRGLLQMVCILL